MQENSVISKATIEKIVNTGDNYYNVAADIHQTILGTAEKDYEAAFVKIHTKIMR